jgi:hypothetical protein
MEASGQVSYFNGRYLFRFYSHSYLAMVEADADETRPGL